jgi:hypothetical protein
VHSFTLERLLTDIMQVLVSYLIYTIMVMQYNNIKNAI